MKITELKLNDKNPRFIKDEKFRKLVQSISEFPKMMELRPIVVDDQNIILGGNMRFRALCELKYKEIPDNWVKKASELTDEEKQRFIIADNVGFGEWDYDLIANEWNTEELESWGLDLPGFDSNINDITEIESFNESVNFTIKCESIEKLEQLQTKLNTSASKMDYNDFLIKAGL